MEIETCTAPEEAGHPPDAHAWGGRRIKSHLERKVDTETMDADEKCGMRENHVSSVGKPPNGAQEGSGTENYP